MDRSARSALIRLASSMPKGSDERKTILASLDKHAWESVLITELTPGQTVYYREGPPGLYGQTEMLKGEVLAVVPSPRFTRVTVRDSETRKKVTVQYSNRTKLPIG